MIKFLLIEAFIAGVLLMLWVLYRMVVEIVEEFNKR
jgi:hypothetical protein